MAPSATNYAEIQQDEIEALRSIYMEAFEEEKAKVGAWNVSPAVSQMYMGMLEIRFNVVMNQ